MCRASGTSTCCAVFCFIRLLLAYALDSQTFGPQDDTTVLSSWSCQAAAWVTGVSGAASPAGVHGLRLQCSDGTTVELQHDGAAASVQPAARGELAQLFNVSSTTGFDAVRVGQLELQPQNPAQVSLRHALTAMQTTSASLWSYPPIAWAAVKPQVFDCAAAAASGSGQVMLLTGMRGAMGPGMDNTSVLTHLSFTCAPFLPDAGAGTDSSSSSGDGSSGDLTSDGDDEDDEDVLEAGTGLTLPDVLAASGAYTQLRTARPRRHKYYTLFSSAGM